MKKTVFFIILLLAVRTLCVREVIGINRDWQFSMNNELGPSARTLVDVPHSWNYDAISTYRDYIRGGGKLHQRHPHPPAVAGQAGLRPVQRSLE